MKDFGADPRSHEEMERTLAKMVMLREVEPLVTQNFKQQAEIGTAVEKLGFD